MARCWEKRWSCRLSWTGADDNILYADNGPAETANVFAGGTVTLTTNDLLPEVMLSVLGVLEEAMTNEAIKTKDPKW